MTEQNVHTPLFLEEIIDLVRRRQIKTVLDATFAEGGHGLALARLGVTVLGLEADEEMWILAKRKIKESGLKNVTVVSGNFRNLQKIAQANGFATVGAVIIDLGLSMYQLSYSDKGFSTKRNHDLDLRLSRRQPKTGIQILNKTSEFELTDWMTRYLESPYCQKLLTQILWKRKIRPIKTVADLRELITYLNLDQRESENLLRQTLQAMRIVVNDELTSIEKALNQAKLVLIHKGLLIILTYHSLEDRLVKQFVKNNLPDFRPIFKPLQNKHYQFARSGKLRAYEYCRQ